MAEVKLQAVGHARVSEKFGVKMPPEVMIEVRKALGRDMRKARVNLLANVSGVYLNRQSGTLANSIKTSIRRKKWEIAAKAGSKHYIGRFWDQGFVTRKGKVMPARPWATTVQNAMKHELETDIRAAIQVGLEKGAK